MKEKTFLNEEPKGQIGFLMIIGIVLGFIILLNFTPVVDSMINTIIPQLNQSNDFLILTIKLFMPLMFLVLIVALYYNFKGSSQQGI